MLVFAHRGFSGLYPENTMLAFEKAIEAGADGIELDIHESRDGELVIIHDESLERTTGIKALVSDLNLKELEGINASKTKADAFYSPIPSFETYLEFARGHNFITNVEIKTGITWYEDIEKKAIEMVRAFGLEDRIIFSSFNWVSAMRAKQLAPEIKCGLLYEDIRHNNLALQAKEAGLEFLHPDFRLLDDEVVKQCKQNNIGLNVWTINTEERMNKLIEWNVNSTITNYPDMCLRMLGR